MTKIYLLTKEYSDDPYSDKTCTSVIAAYATRQAAEEDAAARGKEDRKHGWGNGFGYDVEEVLFENR
jgi:hypothetical protein